MSMCRVFSCVFGRRCLLWAVQSLGRTLLAFALLHSVLQGQICLKNLETPLQSKDITLLTKVHIVKSMVLPLVVYREESCNIKKTEHWRTDAFELWSSSRLLRIPWNTRRSIKPKENQPWIFSGRPDAEAGAPVLWLPNVKSQLIGKDPDGGKDGSQKEKGLAENEMVKWDHQLNGHEFDEVQGIVEDRGAWCATVHWIAMS